jgi:23S rRNA pseudouridine1911/1915/1917 synthase
LKGGEHISLELPVAESTALLPATIPLDIVYEDDYIIVLNKPPGLVVHPGAGHTNDTLVNALLAHTEQLSHIGDPNRPGIVHRLDKDTSGLLIIAKDDKAHLALNELMKERKIHRHYLALVWGEPRQAHFSVNASIGRKPSDRKQMAVVSDPTRQSREAQTEIEVRERFGEISLVEASLSTGRTHQVRVHLSYAGHPVVGDPVYGLRLARAEANRLDNFTRQLIEALPGQALHAYKLAFPHPINGEALEFQTEPPEAFGRLLEHLRLRMVE